MSSESVASEEFRCKFCDKAFQRLSDLRQHERIHTGEKPYQCLVCGKSFSQKSNLKSHVNSHKVWPKPVSRVPDENVLLNSDGKDIHKLYACNFCDSKFLSHLLFRSHLKLHCHEKRFQCTLDSCGLFFEHVKEFVAHRSQVHEGRPDLFTCQMGCGSQKVFTDLDSVALHHFSHRQGLNHHTGEEETKGKKEIFTCTGCKTSFSTAKGLQTHVIATKGHCSVSKKCCSICQKTFVNDKSLRSHLKSHHSASKPTCPLCQRVFSRESYLKLHLRSHTLEIPFKCPECERGFSRKDMLVRHLRTQHAEGRKAFVCDVDGCGKAYTRRDHLKEHSFIHTREKIKCQECDEGFHKHSEYKYHRRLVHKKKKTLQCLKCRKKFSQELERQRHQREKCNIAHQLLAVVMDDPNDSEAVTDLVIYEVKSDANAATYKT